MNKRGGKFKVPVWAEFAYSAEMLLIGAAIPLIISYQNPSSHKKSAGYALEAIAVIGLGLQFLVYLLNSSRRPLLTYLGLSLVASGLLIGFYL